ncbi:MAG: type III-B CRISPR module RAMP protein Cmr6, partial [Bacteroidota bacterium]
RKYAYPEQNEAGKKVSEKFFADKHRKLYSFSLPDYTQLTAMPRLADVPGFHSFTLTTQYPGLLIGTGYTHDIAAVGATKIGFFFDHTTGLPVLPGSSLKGIARAAFPGRDLANAKKEEEPNKKKALLTLAGGKAAYLRTVLTKIGIPEEQVSAADFLPLLEQELFHGHLGLEEEGKPIPTNQRFICHDAVIVDAEGPILGPDFITPHKSRQEGIPDTIVEPNPIQLTKVLAGVRFQFTIQARASYRMPEGPVKATLSPEQTLALVKRILLDLGVGAKTNTGYGQLTAADPAPAKGSGTTSDGKAEKRPVKVNELAKAATPSYFRGRLDYRKELLMDAVVVTPGKPGVPNRVRVYVAEGNTPVHDLMSYRNPLEARTTILVGVRIKKDGTPISVAFRGLKK